MNIWDQTNPPLVTSKPHTLGWHPPLVITEEDLLMEEIFKKHHDNLPVGVVTGALKMGRKVGMTTLHKALQDLFLEMETVQDFLLSPSKDTGRDWKEWERNIYVEFLRRDLDLVSSAIHSGGFASDSAIRDAAEFTPPPLVQDPSVEDVCSEVDSLKGIAPDDFPENYFDEEIFPTKNDILFGRGAGPMKHRGNVKWRRLLRKHKHSYHDLPRDQRKDVAIKIVDEIRNQVPPGRFLQKNKETEMWSEVDDERAVQKATQALRDMASSYRKQLTETEIHAPCTSSP